MPFLELFDETLDINSTDNYELSIQTSRDEFSFCLLDTIRNKFVLIRSFEKDDNKYLNSEQIGDIIQKDDFLKRRYKKINIIIPSSKFTLIPAPLFDPGKKDEYYTFNHVLEESDVILNNKISDPDAFLVFSIAKPVKDLICSIYPDFNLFHNLKPLLWQISHKRKSVSGNYIHVNIERDFFNLIIFDQNGLRFCNTFNYRNISDVLYFVLNVFNNLGIKQEETLWFSGRTERYDDLSSNFSLYVRNVKFAEPTGNFTFSYVFNETDLHRYINLFSAVNCE